MKNEWKSIDERTRNKLEEALDQREMSANSYSQEWHEDGQVDEVAFCENFLQRMPLKCINGFSVMMECCRIAKLKKKFTEW